ncbi:MAG: hypothetical protein AABW47_04930 [Nanoarchaeota archaeon]
MTTTTIEATMEGIVIKIENEFPRLRESFLAGTMELTDVNASSYELLHKYRTMSRENMKGFANCKNLKQDYDARVHKAYDELREEIKQLVMIK